MCARSSDASRSTTGWGRYSRKSASWPPDGALVGFGSFIPELIVDLYAAVVAGDLKTAMALQARINPLKDVVYGGGEPTGDAHARMKMAMYLAGILKSPAVQPPTRLPSGAELKAIEDALRAAGMLKRTT